MAVVEADSRSKGELRFFKRLERHLKPLFVLHSYSIKRTFVLLNLHGEYAMQKKSSLRAILSGLACMSIGAGLTNIAVPARAVHFDFSTPIIGLLTGLYYLGFVVSCFWTPWLVRRVGHIRAFITAAAVVSVCTLGYAIFSNAWFWFLFRSLGGFCIASVYMITESWINDVADHSNRGRVVTYYRVVDLGSLVAGQVSVGWFDISGSLVFMCANVILTLGVVPLALTTSTGPAPIHSIKLNWRKVVGVSRIASGAALTVGLTSGAFFGLGPAFVAEASISNELVGVFMGAPLLSAVLLQVFIGYLADKFDRERLVALVAFLAAIAGLCLGLFDSGPLALIALGCVWGGFAMPIYSLAIAIANDRCTSDDFLDVSGGLLLIYSFGAVIGPALASVIMQNSFHGSLFLYTGVVHICLSGYAIARRNLIIEPVAIESRGEFLAAPQTTPVIFEVDPRNEAEGS